MMQPDIRPPYRAVRLYREKMAEYRAGGATQSVLRNAFQDLLDGALPRRWSLVPQEVLVVDGREVCPDATVRDEFQRRRGHWDARDSRDDLDAEIAKKCAAGYPLANTIFEDARQAVLYQDGVEAMRADLGDPHSVAKLLSQFYGHTEPGIESFDRVAADAEDTVAALKEQMAVVIARRHEESSAFQAIFGRFARFCARSINPNIAAGALDRMIVEHVLVERLMRTTLGVPDFLTRNIVAGEVDRVAASLDGPGFDRAALAGLDGLYAAIDEAAAGIGDLAERQRFLTSVCGRFFADAEADMVATPQPVVDFMCESVADALMTEFMRTLGDHRVHVLDPCAGTGAFIINLLRRVPVRDLPEVYRGRLFADEISLLPYYVAAAGIERAYRELTGSDEPFEGLCFADTLDLAEDPQMQLGFTIEPNAGRIRRERNAPVTIIIGDPPFSADGANAADTNGLRRYRDVSRRIARTYARDAVAPSHSALAEPYVRFFRWASDRLGGRDGIVCFVTDNAFVDHPGLDGMREHLERDFTRIYHVDLRGDARTRRFGVGITIAVRKSGYTTHRILYHRVPDDWRAGDALAWLARRRTASGVPWDTLHPDADHTWLALPGAGEFASFLPISRRSVKPSDGPEPATMFRIHSFGVNTARDRVVYDFDRDVLRARARDFVRRYNAEVDRCRRLGIGTSPAEFVADDTIKWSRDLRLDLRRRRYARYDDGRIRTSLYRPFCRKYLFFDRVLNEEIYSFPRIFPTSGAEEENRVICLSGPGHEAFRAAIAASIVELKFSNTGNGGTACFPFYTYDEDGTNRRENITDEALAAFRGRYGDETITKQDIFHYVYAVLHHPGYRETFAAILRKQLPRIPLAPDFRALAQAGEELANLHLDYDRVEPWPLVREWADGVPPSYRVERMALVPDGAALVVNETLTLAGIPAEAHAYRLGNRSGLEWVIDQYRVKRDRRSGIVSDPNRADDPEYIVNLVARVVRVSVETVGIVERIAALPYAG